MFDRKTYFDHVRQAPFKGSLTQSQIDGQDLVGMGTGRDLPKVA